MTATVIIDESHSQHAAEDLGYNLLGDFACQVLLLKAAA